MIHYNTHTQPVHSLSVLRSSRTERSAPPECCAAFWLGFPNYCLCRHVGAPTGWYADFWYRSDNGSRGTYSPDRCHPTQTIGVPASITSHIFTLIALPAATLPIHPGLKQAPNYAGLHTQRLGYDTHTCVKNNLDFTEARDSEWQWYQLGHMQLCTSLQTDKHASTPPLTFLQAGCPSCHPTENKLQVKIDKYE